jgi:hypothetical protein
MVIVTVNSILPVKISNIRAFEKQNGVQIEWTAYSEENLNKYQIERSINGYTFTSVGDVIARNLLTESKYIFFDPAPLIGINFYRLKSIDMDGRSGFSSVVKINLNKNVKEIKVYPNPVTNGYVSFQSADLEKDNYSMMVFNSAGVQVFRQTFSHAGGAINQTMKLPDGTLPGIYLLQLKNNDAKIMSRTFIVQ